ncbi:MAG TPA: NlpC/P60 family protein [Mycobacteriales bacterium]|nr:NlpC/P60 family protein [Mycobacteriales bacterium]
MPQTRQIALAVAIAAVAGSGAFLAVSPPAVTSAAVVPAIGGTLRAAGADPAASPAPAPAASEAVVAVSVAEVWSGRHKVRSFDLPALQRPAHITAWLRRMTFHQRSHLYQRLATQVRYGEQVDVLDAWGSLTQIRIPDQTGGRFPDGIIGWVASEQLAPEPADWTAPTQVATVTAKLATLHRVVGGADHPIDVSYATTLPVLAVHPHVVVVAVPGPVDRATLSRAAVRVHRLGTPAIRPNRHDVLAQARRFLGLPYLWAGMSAWGYDCSGLTSTIYSQLGITLPRDAADQSLVGKPVPRNRLRPGDLVFFSHTPQRGDIHHVAIYAGRGRVLQSPYTGSRVEIVKLRHSYLNREYWGASRPLP